MNHIPHNLKQEIVFTQSEYKADTRNIPLGCYAKVRTRTLIYIYISCIRQNIYKNYLDKH